MGRKVRIQVLLLDPRHHFAAGRALAKSKPACSTHATLTKLAHRRAVLGKPLDVEPKVTELGLGLGPRVVALGPDHGLAKGDGRGGVFKL